MKTVQTRTAGNCCCSSSSEDMCAGWYCCEDTHDVIYIADCSELDAILDCYSNSSSTYITYVRSACIDNICPMGIPETLYFAVDDFQLLGDWYRDRDDFGTISPGSPLLFIGMQIPCVYDVANDWWQSDYINVGDESLPYPPDGTAYSTLRIRITCGSDGGVYKLHVTIDFAETQRVWMPDHVGSAIFSYGTGTFFDTVPDSCDPFLINFDKTYDTSPLGALDNYRIIGRIIQ